MGRFHSWRGAFVLVASLASASAMGAYLQCDPQYTHQIGNGYCNTESNTEACGYDGGDCCGCTCQNSDLFECGINGYNCLDPDTACADLVEIETARELMDAVSMAPTMTPTSSPTASPSSSLDGVLPTPSNSPRGGSGAAIDATPTSSKGGVYTMGIVIAVIALAVVILLIVCVWRKRRSFSRDATDGYSPPGQMQYA